MQRTMKSELELTQMMMAEPRKHPECTEWIWFCYYVRFSP
jgi:hypothetical protein